ncbi:TraB/GumN family protein [Chakrabartia godavariana]|nr:TraB/GumN family protein [Chakrabartia godavariana]
MRKRMALCAMSALNALLLAPASEAATSARPSAPHPAIWKIADADTTIYLFGTTHALPKGFRWQSPALKQIVAQADELVLETVDSPEANKKAEGAVDDTINPVLPDRPIAARVAPDKQALLKRAIARTDFPEQFYDAMPTWMASLVLAVEDMSKDGLSHDNGVEAVLQKAFARAGRPILAVEDGSAILRQMHGLSEAAQRKMLEDTLDDMATTKPGGASPNDIAWAAGDTSQLDADFTEEKLGSELYNVLVRQRNIAWTRWLTARMAKPGTVLFAVGAGHLAGPESLQHLLEEKGIAVARLD